MACQDTIVIPLPRLLDVIEGARAAVICELALEGLGDIALERNSSSFHVDRYVWRSFTSDANDLFGGLVDDKRLNYIKDIIVGCIEVNPKIDDGELVDVMSALGIQTY